MGYIRDNVNYWLGNEVTVIHRPDSRSSLLNRQESARDKAIRELRLAQSNGDDNKILEILADITSRTQIQEIFEANQIGVEDRKSLKLFRELSSKSSSPEVREKAQEIVFAYAQERSSVLIKQAGTNTAHPQAAEILTNIQAYLSSDTPEKKKQSLSSVASALGYHITGLRQAVLGTAAPDAKAHKNNNLLWQLYNHNGIGSVIYSILNESDFITDNKELMHTRFTQDQANMDTSMNGDLQKANLLHQTKQSVMGIFGSWSSCNFDFKLPKIDSTTGNYELNSSGQPVFENYNLEQLLTDVCNEGPAEANNRFIDAYVRLTEYKERLREDPANARAVKRLEKEQTKALKFLFDSNKLQSTGSEGDLIYQALQENMKSHGSMRFLSSLFKAVMGPNEIAEVRTITSLYKNAFNRQLVFKENGNSKVVETLRDYRLALEQRIQEYSDTIKNFRYTNNSLEIFNQAKHDFEVQCRQLTESHISINDFKAYCQNNFSISFSTGASSPGTTETAQTVIDYAKSQLPQTFAEYGESYEKYIKNSGSINALAEIRGKSSADLSPDEQLILRILAEDKVTVEGHNNGKPMEGFIESLFNRRVANCPDVNSSVLAARELMRRIDESGALNAESAKKLVLTKIIGYDDNKADSIVSSGNTLGENEAKKLYSLHHEINVLEGEEEPIRERAKKKFSTEIVRFIKMAIPNADIDSLEQSEKTLDELLKNLTDLQSCADADPKRHELELANLAKLGINPDSSNSFGFDENMYIGSLLDPKQDLGMIEMFIETIKSVFEYIKMMNRPSPNYETRAEQKEKKRVSLNP
jgi:hypothetical protein